MHLMAGVFENQDHNKFDYYALSYTDKPDDGSIVSLIEFENHLETLN